MTIARIPARGERIFATGLKGWVQLRAAAGPPRVRVTIAKVPSTKQVYVPAIYHPNGNYTPPRYKEIPCTLSLKVHLFEGGEVLRTVKVEEFARTIGVAVREGGMMELLPEQVAKFAIIDPPQVINEPAF